MRPEESEPRATGGIQGASALCCREQTRDNSHGKPALTPMIRRPVTRWIPMKYNMPKNAATPEGYHGITPNDRSGPKVGYRLQLFRVAY